MLEEFFESPVRIQELRCSPDGRLLEGFARELCKVGYAEITARRHMRAAEHLIHWIGRKGGTVAALDERMIEEFVRRLKRCEAYKMSSWIPSFWLRSVAGCASNAAPAMPRFITTASTYAIC